MPAAALRIQADWERLDIGSPEERACFAAIGIQHGDVWLTEAEDAFVHRVRQSVHLSAYSLAEWLAWNWWRLRWEPRRRSPDWAMAHRMATVGGGYVWPNVTITSDGERVAVIARPTRPNAAEPLRYIADEAVTVPASDFEAAVDAFLEQVRGQLDAEGVRGTNLDAIWREVLQERADPEAALRRKLEALLGRDPGEAEDAEVERFVEDGATLGAAAAAEVAATGEAVHADDFRALAVRAGQPIRLGDAARLSPEALRLLPRAGPAWLRGAGAAKALRRQEDLGQRPISDKRLSTIAGTASPLTAVAGASTPLTFVLDAAPSREGIVVLRPRTRDGRRFELSRLVGDRIAVDEHGLLHPATRADTYRQKLQRAFAAEFLAPFEAVQDMLDGDLSDEAQETVAEHFAVSPWVVRTQLLNNGLLGRDHLSADGEVIAA